MVYAGHDRLEPIDLPEVRDRADAACAPMAGVPGANGSAVPDPETILAENNSVSSMVASVKSLGAKVLNDDPSHYDRLKDWETLVNLRNTYSEELRLNPSAAKPQIPEVEGVPFLVVWKGSPSSVEFPTGSSMTSPAMKSKQDVVASNLDTISTKSQNYRDILLLATNSFRLWRNHG